MPEIAEKLRNCEEFVAKKQIEQDSQELMNCLCIKRITYDRKSTVDSNSGFAEQSKFLERCKRISRSRNSERLWSVPRSQSTLDYSEPQSDTNPRFWIASKYTEYNGYFGKRF